MEQNVTNTETTVNEEVKKAENVVEVVKLDMKAHAEFEAVADTAITTTDDLGKVINSIFGEVFDDYYGCTLKVEYMPNYCAYVVFPMLYFKVLSNEEYRNAKRTAFLPMSEVAADSMVARVQRLSRIAATSGVKVEMTADGKSILEDFVIKNSKINQNVHLEDSFDWTQAYNVIPTENGTFVRVFKLDMFNLLKMIYGDKSADGSKQYYQITPTGTIGAVTQYQKPSNWSLIIMRLDGNNLNYAAKNLGIYMQIPEVSGMPNVNTERLNHH